LGELYHVKCQHYLAAALYLMRINAEGD
jgi:hypothetical protein